MTEIKLLKNGIQKVFKISFRTRNALQKYPVGNNKALQEDKLY